MRLKKQVHFFVVPLKHAFTDAKNNFIRSNNAATYLQNSTSTALYTKFNPVIKTRLVKLVLIKVWTNIITKYNSSLLEK
jgi:hypothetical protein